MASRLILIFVTQGVFVLQPVMARLNLPGAPGTREVKKQLARWHDLLV